MWRGGSVQLQYWKVICVWGWKLGIKLPQIYVCPLRHLAGDSVKILYQGFTLFTLLFSHVITVGIYLRLNTSVVSLRDPHHLLLTMSAWAFSTRKHDLPLSSRESLCALVNKLYPCLWSDLKYKRKDTKDTTAKRKGNKIYKYRRTLKYSCFNRGANTWFIQCPVRLLVQTSIIKASRIKDLTKECQNPLLIFKVDGGLCKSFPTPSLILWVWKRIFGNFWTPCFWNDEVLQILYNAHNPERCVLSGT